MEYITDSLVMLDGIEYCCWASDDRFVLWRFILYYERNKMYYICQVKNTHEYTVLSLAKKVCTFLA